MRLLVFVLMGEHTLPTSRWYFVGLRWTLYYVSKHDLYMYMIDL